MLKMFCKTFRLIIALAVGLLSFPSLTVGLTGTTSNSYDYNVDQNTCKNQVDIECSMSGSQWNGGLACSAVNGGFLGNSHNLNVMMKNHFQDSFKFLVTVSDKCTCKT